MIAGDKVVMNIHYYKSSMPRLTKDQVFDKIRSAVVTVVAHNGIGAASVGEIAKVAQVSAGTIYLHFENKDDMLQQVYLRIKRAFHGTLMQARSETAPRDLIRAMWLHLFAFLQTRPNDFLYLEYAGAAQVLTPDQKATIAPLQAEVNALLQQALDDAGLSHVALDIAETLLIGPAMHLARKAVLSERNPSPKEVDETFDRVWASLTM